MPEANSKTITVGVTGASGALLAQKMLTLLDADPRVARIHLVITETGQRLLHEELAIPAGPSGSLVARLIGRACCKIELLPNKDVGASIASGSYPVDAMVVIPCTMGTIGRIAHGVSSDVLLRAADVMLKERRKLILVPRETPLNLVHVKNFELLLLAGAIILPANPSFYSCPKTLEQAADTVVARVMDHIGIAHQLMPRWQEEQE